MAERRMFAKTIIDSDAFLDMSVTAQLLYFHLSMRADDDGFVNKPKSIMRMIGASQGDAEMLVNKKFIIPFESGVVVIKHWKIHNYIAKDRYKETTYKDEKATLMLDENNAYTTCIQPVYGMDTQDRLGKERIGKDRLDSTVSKDTVSRTEVQPKFLKIIEAWNSLTCYGIKGIQTITPNTKRYEWLNARLKQYGEDNVLLAIEKIRQSDFLKGDNKKGWVITFDWFVKPNNFPKVLEGNYDNREHRPMNKTAQMLQDSYDMMDEWATATEGEQQNEQRRV